MGKAPLRAWPIPEARGVSLRQVVFHQRNQLGQHDPERRHKGLQRQVRQADEENFQQENHKEYLQHECEVLVENKLNNQEKYFGRTKYMTPVIFDADSCKPGELINVKITSFNKKNLFGAYKTHKVEAA